MKFVTNGIVYRACVIFIKNLKDQEKRKFTNEVFQYDMFMEWLKKSTLRTRGFWHHSKLQTKTT